MFFPQVSFAAFLINDGSLSSKACWNVFRARFDRKIADFLICDRDTRKALAIVDLDDRTHSEPSWRMICHTGFSKLQYLCVTAYWLRAGRRTDITDEP